MICIGQLCKQTVQKILVSIDWSDVMVLLENIWIEASWSYSPCLQFKERPIDYQSAVNERPFISQCSHVTSPHIEMGLNSFNSINVALRLPLRAPIFILFSSQPSATFTSVKKNKKQNTTAVQLMGSVKFIRMKYACQFVLISTS